MTINPKTLDMKSICSIFVILGGLLFAISNLKNVMLANFVLLHGLLVSWAITISTLVKQRRGL